MVRCSWLVARKNLPLYSDGLWSNLTAGSPRASPYAYYAQGRGPFFLRPANCGPLLIVFQKGFRILADFFQVQALVAGPEDAAAVGLAVEVVGFGHFRRCEEAVVFLEVRRQVGVAVLVFDIPADFVDDLRVLMGADGQGRREIVIAQFLHLFSCRLHALDEADAAAGAAFRFVFQALDDFKVRLRFIGRGQEMDVVASLFVIGFDELFLDEFPPPVFGFRMDIGVEIVDRHISHAGQPIQDGRTTRAAAGMEQDPRLDAFLLPTAGHALEYFIEVDPLVLIHAVQNFMKINHRLYSLSNIDLFYIIP